MTTTFVRVGSRFFNLSTMFEITICEPTPSSHRKELEVRFLRGELAGPTAYGPDAELLRAYLEGRAVNFRPYVMQPGNIRVYHLLSVVEPPVEAGDDTGASVEALAEEEVAS